MDLFHKGSIIRIFDFIAVSLNKLLTAIKYTVQLRVARFIIVRNQFRQ